MKFTTLFVVLATVFTAVSATLTNGQRLARGLTPNPPVRRHGGGSSTHGGHAPKPSGIHGSCNTGKMHCCNSVTHATPQVASLVQDVAGLVVGPEVSVGLTCSPIHALGLGSGSCSAQTVCCEGNNYRGVVVIGCSPINVNLV